MGPASAKPRTNLPRAALRHPRSRRIRNNSGPYTIERLGRDAVGILDSLGIDAAHFCGLSLGGIVGMWLGVNRPVRIARLALCNTAAKIGTPESWNARIDAVRNGGMAAIAPTIIERWFTRGSVNRSRRQS